MALTPQDSLEKDGLVTLLGIRITELDKTHCCAEMPITPAIMQPFGFVHGGATLTLLETVGSRAARERSHPETEATFGIHMDVRHIKSGVAGTVYGSATLESTDGAKQYWHVEARDDSGAIMSLGTFTTKTVTWEYLEEKRRRQEAEEQSAQL